MWNNFANLLCGSDQQPGRPTEKLRCHRLPSLLPPRQIASGAKKTTEAPPMINCEMGNGRIHKILALRHGTGVKNPLSGGMDSPTHHLDM